MTTMSNNRKRNSSRSSICHDENVQDEDQEQAAAPLRDDAPVGGGGDAAASATPSMNKKKASIATKSNANKDDADLRSQIEKTLAGAAFVFRFGNPSTQPWSVHEKATLKEALKNQERQELDDEVEDVKGDDNTTATSAAEHYFTKSGVTLENEIITPELEQRLWHRILDLLVEETRRRNSRRTAAPQSFGAPFAVGNRELYFVPAMACRIIKRQQGRPFMPGCDMRVAWAVEGCGIPKLQSADKGDNKKSKKGTKTKPQQEEVEMISQTWLRHQNGSALLPDVEGHSGHPQNLDNPLNACILELLHIIETKFANVLRNDQPSVGYVGGGERPYNMHQYHTPMCLQLILGEHTRTTDGGRRGLHEDKWSMTGAAVVAVTIIGQRTLTMQHKRQSITYLLRRRSAYALSGAARFGTLWKSQGLISPYMHGLSAFEVVDTKNDEE